MISTSLYYRVTYGPSFINQFYTASSCTVISTILVRCYTDGTLGGISTSTGLVTIVTIGTLSVQAPAAQSLFYNSVMVANPNLYGITLSTNGTSTIVLRGRCFGPMMTSAMIDVWGNSTLQYYRGTTLLNTSQCQSINNTGTDLLCATPIGWGRSISFGHLIIADTTNNLDSSWLLDYTPPSVTGIIATIATFATIGNEIFTIQGVHHKRN